ncbi:MAG: NAD(+) diphosphatase [Geminicoccaceae bacterium]
MHPVNNRPPHVYSGVGFDRAGNLRRDDAWLAARRSDPATRVLPMSGLKVLVGGDDASPRALLPALAELDRPLPAAAVFLGRLGDTAVFSADFGEPEMPGGHFVELRSVGTLLPAAEAGLLAYARGLAHWHARHRFCGACGTENGVTQGGHARPCPACGNETFPRTDPAVIVLVTDGDRCLLGRADRFPPGMYSTLAGFVEPGESLEETLRREVFEEVGVELGEVRYRSSQPWPFPQSLMLGFRAQALSTAIVIDPHEIEDARWFERGELRDEARRPVRLPGPDSIARYLVDEWLAEGD